MWTTWQLGSTWRREWGAERPGSVRPLEGRVWREKRSRQIMAFCTGLGQEQSAQQQQKGAKGQGERGPWLVRMFKKVLMEHMLLHALQERHAMHEGTRLPGNAQRTVGRPESEYWILRLNSPEQKY